MFRQTNKQNLKSPGVKGIIILTRKILDKTQRLRTRKYLLVLKFRDFSSIIPRMYFCIIGSAIQMVLKRVINLEFRNALIDFATTSSVA